MTTMYDTVMEDAIINEIYSINDINVTTHFSKPIECTSSKVDPNVNYEL